MEKVMLPYKYYLFLLIFHFYSNFQLNPKQEIIPNKALIAHHDTTGTKNTIYLST